MTIARERAFHSDENINNILCAIMNGNYGDNSNGSFMVDANGVT